jgi:hypothetical protein
MKKKAQAEAYYNLALLSEKQKKYYNAVNYWKRYLKYLTDETIKQKVRDRIKTLVEKINNE